MSLTVKEFLKLIIGSDMLQIVKDDKTIFTGWASMPPEEYLNETVKQFRAVPEIKHKQWKELGLMAPIEPDKTPQYSFSDLQMNLYYTLHI